MHSALQSSRDDESAPDSVPGTGYRAAGLDARTEVRDLLRRFNPRLVGFGIIGPSASHLHGRSEYMETGQSRTVDSSNNPEAKW
jgi:hypothetical protein